MTFSILDSFVDVIRMVTKIAIQGFNGFEIIARYRVPPTFTSHCFTAKAQGVNRKSEMYLQDIMVVKYGKQHKAF